MNEPVAQGPRHREMHSPLGGRVAGGDDYPPVRQHILAQLAVEHQLVAAGLRHLWRRGQLIEKQDAFPTDRKELGRHPLGLVCLDPWQSPQIDRIELDSANVYELKVEIVRHLRDDLRFTDSACTPDVQGHAFADQRMKRLIKLGWFHLDLPQEKYWFGCEERPVGRLFGDALDSPSPSTRNSGSAFLPALLRSRRLSGKTTANLRPRGSGVHRILLRR